MELINLSSLSAGLDLLLKSAATLALKFPVLCAMTSNEAFNIYIIMTPCGIKLTLSCVNVAGQEVKMLLALLGL